MTKTPADFRERLDSQTGPLVIFIIVASTIVVAIAVNLFDHMIQISKQPKLLRRRKRHPKIRTLATTLFTDYYFTASTNIQISNNTIQSEIINFIRESSLRGLIDMLWFYVFYNI